MRRRRSRPRAPRCASGARASSSTTRRWTPRRRRRSVAWSRRGSPEAWVTVRARSRGIDRVRSVRRREEMFVAPLGETAAATPETGGNPVEDRELAQGFLRELPPEQRGVIALAYLQGMTQSEIAARLGLPLGTVKTRTRLGMERLRGMAGSRT